MSDLVVVYGTRPEAIKLGPVVAELKALGVQPDVVATGQHWDLLRGTPAESDLQGSESLALASDGHMARWLTKAEAQLRQRLASARVVVVQGDTMSALAGGRAGAELGLTVVHVEAGVRSHNAANPWPEETIRVELAKLANWHCAPTRQAEHNLLAEGINEAQIVVTGNTVVSALARYAPGARFVGAPEQVVVVTMHRREVQTPEMARRVWGQVYQLAMRNPGWRIFWPIHPGFARFLDGRAGQAPPNMTLSGPMPYASFAGVVARAMLVVTDSGGLVEEACTLGVPTVVWRGANDRPEAVAAGLAVVADPEEELLESACKAALSLPRRASEAFGTPAAAQLVAAHLRCLL